MQSARAGRDRPRGWLRKALASDFVQKIIEIFLTRILLVVIGFLTGVIVARILGPEGRGLFAVAGAVAGIAIQFGNLGLHSANTYEVARDRDRISELLGNSLMVSLAMGGLAALGTWALFRLRPDLLPIPPLLLALAVVSIPLSLAFLFAQNLLLGLQDVRSFNKIELANRIATVLLIGVVILIGMVTPETVFLAGLLAGAANLGWVFWRLRPHLPRPPRLSRTRLRQSLAYGFRAYLACFFAFLVVRFDLLMIQYILGSEESGHYAIAVGLADLLYLLPTAVGAILFPKLSAMDSTPPKWRLASRTAGVVAALMIPTAALAVLVARPGIGLIYGEEYLPAAPAFMILAVAIVLLGVNTMFSNYLASIGLPWFAVHIWLVLMLANVGLNLLWIPAHGIAGAAWSSLACYGAALIGQGVYALRYARH